MSSKQPSCFVNQSCCLDYSMHSIKIMIASSVFKNICYVYLRARRKQNLKININVYLLLFFLSLTFKSSIVSFQIYDCDGDNMISRDELKSMAAATLRERGIVLRNEELDQVISETLLEISPKIRNMISYDEYVPYCNSLIIICNNITRNISSIVYLCIHIFRFPSNMYCLMLL